MTRPTKRRLRDEFTDGVIYAAAEMVRAFDLPTAATHLLEMVGGKRGLPMDERALRRVRADAARRLK